MKSLHLHVKDGARVYINAVVLFDVFSQTYFVLVLDVHELMLSLLIIYINSQAFDSRQIGDPLVTYMLGYPFCKKRVTMKQETSLGNTIGLVVEFLRHHLVEILQLSLCLLYTSTGNSATLVDKGVMPCYNRIMVCNKFVIFRIDS